MYYPFQLDSLMLADVTVHSRVVIVFNDVKLVLKTDDNHNWKLWTTRYGEYGLSVNQCGFCMQFFLELGYLSCGCSKCNLCPFQGHGSFRVENGFLSQKLHF